MLPKGPTRFQATGWAIASGAGEPDERRKLPVRLPTR